MTALLARTTLATAGLIALFSSAPSFGQAAAGAPAATGGLEEVVVTATRRAERLQDVPISVTAFSQEKLDAQGLKNIDDLSRLSPGLNFSRNGMGSSANYNDENSDIAIRGIDSAAGAATTGIYIDDTPVQSRHIGFGAVTVFPALFDLDRIEVLRGPQGTLFGAGAEGGVVRFITPTPGLNTYSGYVRSEYATTDHGDPSYELGVAVGGPIIDNVLGFRFSVSYRRDGGWVDRVNYTRAANDYLTLPVYAGTTEKAANFQQTATARLAFKWQPTENLSIATSVYFQELQIHDTAAYWQVLSDPSGEVFRNGNALRNPSADPYYLASVKVDWNLGFAQLASNTAYFSRDQHSTSDYTQYLRATWAFFNSVGFGTLTNPYPQPGDAGYAPFHDRQDNVYQEIRLASTEKDARVSWNAGLFYARTNENIPEDIIDPTLEAESGGTVCAVYGIACPNGLIYHGPIDRVIEKQIAAFGELTVKLADHWKATVGLRVSKDDVEGTVISGGAFVVTPLSPIPTLVVTSSEKPVTPKFALDYQPDRDNLFYLSAAKGYRSGGVNIPVGALCDGDLITLGLPVGADGHPHVPDSYTSDSLWSYEIGAKNSLLDRRLQINSSVFVVNWKKIIQNVYLPSCGEQFAANLGQVQSKGGDVEVQFKPAQPLTLDLTVAYTDAKYTRASCAGALTPVDGVCTGPGVPGAPPVVSKGDRLPGAPWTFLGWAELAAPFAQLDGKVGYFRVDYQQTTAQSALTPGQNGANALFDTTIPGLPTTKNLSLRAGLRFNGLDVSIFGNNMLNDHPKLFSSRDIADNQTDNLYFGRSVRPRTIGVTATYHY